MATAHSPFRSLFPAFHRSFATSKPTIPWRKKKRLILAKQKRIQVTEKDPNRYIRTPIKRQNYIIDSAPDGKRWRILAASVLHRYPVIQPDDKPYVQDFARVQYELSLREDAEIPEGLWTLEPGEEHMSSEDIPSPFEPIDPDLIIGDGFSPAPRITKEGTFFLHLNSNCPNNFFPTDLDKNQKSLNRALDRHLILLLRQPKKTAMTPYSWFFPHAVHNPSEKMRKTAILSFVQACGKKCAVYPMGNAPIGHLSYLHTDSEFDGTKIFFYKSRIIGDAELQLKPHRAEDFVWVNRDELKDYLESELASYMHKIIPQ